MSANETIFLLIAIGIYLYGAILAWILFLVKNKKEEGKFFKDVRWDTGCTRTQFLVLTFIACLFWPALIKFEDKK